MSDTDDYETMTQHDLIEIINHWEQLAFKKTMEVRRLREVIQRVVTILGPDEIETEELLVDALKEMIEAGGECTMRVVTNAD